MVDMPQNTIKQNPIYLIYIYKEDLSLNNLQWLICHKTQLTDLTYTMRFNLQHKQVFLCCHILSHIKLLHSYIVTFNTFKFLFTQTDSFDVNT